MHIENGFYRYALRLAWPISLQSVLTSVLSMIDITMVSHLGDSAVAAVGLSNRFLFVIMVILLGNAWAVGVLSAQYVGAQQHDKIRGIIALGCVLANLLLLPLLIWIQLGAEHIIGLGSDNLDVRDLGQHYLRIVAPSLMFVAATLAFDNALRGLGEVKTPLLINSAAIALNIVLNFWLINGGLGIPALGVGGAAIATTLSRAAQLALILSVLRRRQHQLQFRFHDLHIFQQRTRVGSFIRLATPMMLSFGVWSTGTFVYQIIYGNIGTRELAVISLLTPIEGIYVSLFFGLASACSIIIGQCLGANRFDDAWRYAKQFTFVNPLLAFACGLVIFLSRDILLRPFHDLPAETRELASDILIVMCVFTWIKVICMTVAMGVLRAGGDTTMVTVIDLVGMWFVGLPLTAATALWLNWPLVWVFLVSYSEEICKCVLFIWRMRKRHWLKNLAH